MFSIVACPRCAGQVSIPSGASPTAHVCCPLCDSQYPLSELLAALPPALVIVDGPAEAHAAESAVAQAHADAAAAAAAHPASYAATEPEWKEGHEFDMEPMSFGEPLSLGKPESMEAPHSFDDLNSHEAPHSLEAAHGAADMLDDVDLLETPHAFGTSHPADEATIAMQAPQFAAPEHAGFQDHDLQDLGEPQEIGFPTEEESPPHDMFASAEDEFSETSFDDSPPPASPFAEQGQEELPEMEFAAADEFAAPEEHGFSAPGEHEFAAPADEFAAPGEHDFPGGADEFAAPADEFAVSADEFSVPADEFSAPGEHDFSASGEDEFAVAADDEFAAAGENAFASSEEGEFGSIEKQSFHGAAPLQQGDFHREVGEDTGEEIGLAEEGDEFSLPAPAVAEAAKGKKGAKAAKPAKAKAAKSDKPKRSLVSTLLLMLIVPLLAVGGLASLYLGILWVLKRDAIGIAGMLPSSLVPAEFRKGPMRTLAGGPGMPATNPLDQPPAGLPGAMPDEEPAAGQTPPSPDGLDPAAPAPAGQKPAGKPAGDEEEMPAEKPNAAPADDEAFTGTKPKPKAADDGFGADPAEKKPAGDLDDPLSDKAPPAKMTGAKVPAEDTLGGDEPAAKPAAGGKPAAEMKDDLGFDEPADKKPKAPADEPAKEDPAEPAAPPVTPVDAPTYTLADLGQAMTDVSESVATMAESAALSEADLKKARAQYFRRFYRLGEVVTFAEDDEAAPRLAEEKAAITALLKKTASDETKLTAIGRAATKWLAFAKRGEHAGILLAGTVAEVIHEGKLYEITIAVPGVEEPVSVFSGTKPNVAEEDRVILLGSVIDDPTANLPEYTGTDPAVVWNGLTVKLAAAAAAEEPAEETK